MLLLYPLLTAVCASETAIYIPLCFYFILKKDGNGSGVSDLHSIMLLLYQGLSCVPAVFSRTFTFHYASTLSLFMYHTSCTGVSFTFHYASTLSHVLAPFIHFLFLFTFHYASTLSFWLRHRTCLLSGFTFHYASTLSAFPATLFITLFNLHSIMLLLYRVSVLRPCADGRIFTFHYASTLSGQTKTRLIINTRFTFHYASTLSLCFCRGRHAWNGFTFHYASTLSISRRGYPNYQFIFTFHYASTLSGLVQKDQYYFSYLHSIMLLLYLYLEEGI